MPPQLLRFAEITFTAYVVPALLVPVIWLIGWLIRRGQARRAENPRELGRLLGAHFALVVLWALVWAAMALGLPLQNGGALTIAACWTAYLGANFLLAWVLVRFTATYGSLPNSAATDAVFVRLLGTLLAQPVMTALAFSVLARTMGVAWHLHIPTLPAVQEGI